MAALAPGWHGLLAIRALQGLLLGGVPAAAGRLRVLKLYFSQRAAQAQARSGLLVRREVAADADQAEVRKLALEVREVRAPEPQRADGNPGPSHSLEEVPCPAWAVYLNKLRVEVGGGEGNEQ